MYVHSHQTQFLADWTNYNLYPTVKNRHSPGSLPEIRGFQRCLRNGRHGSRGFSLIELVVVITVIAVLVTVAASKLWGLQVDAERVAMEQVLGNLRSALGINVATYLVTGDMAGMQTLEGSNPMDRLAEVPSNYLGTVNGTSMADSAGGAWYFDTRSRTLIYRVRNADYFRGGAGTPAQARFAVQLVYEDRGLSRASGPRLREIVGARLAALEPYAWVQPDQELEVR
jgi:prepilin-type N-terminal cleavage/methylation domain-containing protein